MSEIQTDVSDRALVRAIRANMCDFFRHTSRNNPAEHFENDNFVRWHTALQHPWFNGALSINPPQPDADKFITDTIKYFRAKNIGTFTWWLDARLKPADWGPTLSKHGFGFSDDTPGMAVDLQALNEPAKPVPGFEIRTVNDEESLHVWARVFVHGYGLPPNWADIVTEVWSRYGLEFPVKNYLGYLDGQPVSTSTIFYGGGAAGIYSVATLPQARGKGLGRAITLQPLLEAREMGYRVGVLQSSDMGFSVYKKLGFRHLCQIENFFLPL